MISLIIYYGTKPKFSDDSIAVLLALIVIPEPSLSSAKVDIRFPLSTLRFFKLEPKRIIKLRN